MLGYAVGAAAWILNRVIGVARRAPRARRADVRKRGRPEPRRAHARAWLVGLTILAVGLAGEREDGLTAAILVLAAFTVYFVSSLLLRPLERNSPRP